MALVQHVDIRELGSKYTKKCLKIGKHRKCYYL